jgi:hypothetical protein
LARVIRVCRDIRGDVGAANWPSSRRKHSRVEFAGAEGASLIGVRPAPSRHLSGSIGGEERLSAMRTTEAPHLEFSILVHLPIMLFAVVLGSS